jgi:hypothetical protein
LGLNDGRKEPISHHDILILSGLPFHRKNQSIFLAALPSPSPGSTYRRAPSLWGRLYLGSKCDLPPGVGKTEQKKDVCEFADGTFGPELGTRSYAHSKKYPDD